MNWIPVARALELSGHPSAAALGKWRRRMVQRYPGLRIRVRPGYINEVDLKEALRQAELPSPGTIAARASTILANARPRRTA